MSDTIKKINLRFDSGNSVPVDSARITREEWNWLMQERNAALEREQALAAHAGAIADAVGLPSHNSNRRKTSVIVINIKNMQRFSEYLAGVEREFLMAPGEVDEDYPSLEPEDKCLVNSWGAKSCDHYIEQFRNALAHRDLIKQAEAL